MAANLAVGLAQLWGCPTVLVDLVPVGGQGGLMLNVSPRYTWADLADKPLPGIDDELIGSLLSQHASGAALLAAPSWMVPFSPSSASCVHLRRMSSAESPTCSARLA